MLDAGHIILELFVIVRDEIPYKCFEKFKEESYMIISAIVDT